MIPSVKQILQDFEKIKKHLDVDEDYKLYLALESDEGFCDIKRKWIFLGVEGGYYSRVLLVHECVHATGMNHNGEKGYFSTVRFDSYSYSLENEIFGGK